MRLLMCVLLVMYFTSLGAFAAEERDGVTYYTNDDIGKSKARSTPDTRTTPSQNESTYGTSDVVVKEVSEVICNKNETSRDPDNYSFEQIQERFNRLQWLKYNVLPNETNILKRNQASQIIDSCYKVWKITFDMKVSRRNTDNLLNDVRRKAYGR